LLVAGLNAEYYSFAGENEVPANILETGVDQARVETQLNYFNNFELNEALGLNKFYAKYIGYIKAPVTGSLVLSVKQDDGVIITFDGVVVINAPFYNNLIAIETTVNVVAGRYYPIDIRYWDNGGGTALQLSWRYANVGTTVVPANAFWRV
jgi:hypothetical protein